MGRAKKRKWIQSQSDYIGVYILKEIKWRDEQEKLLGPKGHKRCDCDFVSSGDMLLTLNFYVLQRNTYTRTN